MRRVAIIGALVIGLSSCGGDGERETARPAPTATSTESALPPEFLDCMADNGYDVERDGDIHSAPMELLQRCFGALHGGTPGG
jgi:hypothetical protein